jgi:DNA-binding response OmpR family regulator
MGNKDQMGLATSPVKKILITEDDPGILDVLTIIFERANFEVVPHPDGNTILAGEFELPDIFLLDKQLSGVDGLDICRYLKSREQTTGIPVVIMSATPYLKVIAKQAGADAFIEKPFSNKDLVQLIEGLTTNQSSPGKEDF